MTERTATLSLGPPAAGRERSIVEAGCGRSFWVEDAAGVVRISSNGPLVGSLLLDGRHMPLLDVDVPLTLEEVRERLRLAGYTGPFRAPFSSSVGHRHVYVDMPMSWDRMLALLEAAERAGLTNAGYIALVHELGQCMVLREGQPKSALRSAGGCRKANSCGSTGDYVARRRAGKAAASQ